MSSKYPRASQISPAASPAAPPELSPELSLRASFARFLGCGGLCFGVGLALLYGLTEVWHWHPLLAWLVGSLATNALGFTLNRRFAFRARARHFWPELARYYGVTSGSLALNLGLMTLLVSGLGVPYLGASVGLSLAMAVFNFALHRLWSFQGR